MSPELKKIFSRTGPLLLALALTTAAAAARAAGPRFALLPLSDLSIDYNGIDLETTRELDRIMEELGCEAVPTEAVYDFMARQQIYDAGFLNTFNIRKLGDRLNCELVLTGTVTETPKQERDPGRFGLLLNGYSGRTGAILFTLDLASSQDEEITLLALGEPRSQAELKELVMERVRRELATLLLRGLPSAPDAAATGCPCELTSRKLTPDFVRSGQPVTVTLRLNCLDRFPGRLSLRTENGRRLSLEPTGRTGEYRGELTAEKRPGTHPLTLEIPAADAGTASASREIELAGYRVSNQPPPVTVELKQGLRLTDGVTVFSRQLLLVSHYPRDLPIDRWQVEVTTPDGSSIFREDYNGELPRRMFWQGWNQQHRLLAEGSYRFILRVWDRAGNRREIVMPIAIQRSCIAITVRTEKGERGRPRLRLEPAEPTTPGRRNLLEQWHLSLYNNLEQKLCDRSGKRLPAIIELPENLKGDFIRYELEARDRLGNHFVLNQKRLYLPGREPGRAKQRKLQIWNQDF